jgi:uncharacterized protein YbjT (DUF2867 family)
MASPPPPRVCVTGGGGYVASWLVKLLLSRGYAVHATVRDPSNKHAPPAHALFVLIDRRVGNGDSCGVWLSVSGDPKNAHLQVLDGAPESLLLFTADMLDRDALAAAVAGCEGVFHVASPVPADKVHDPEASFGPVSSDDTPLILAFVLLRFIA